MIKVGQIYEITEQWLSLKGNEIFPKMIPQFKEGALFEVLEVSQGVPSGQATCVKCLTDGTVWFADTAPTSAYAWCFFTSIEVKRQYIILKGNVK